MKAEWTYTVMEDGRAFVMMLGTLKTLMSFADSWGMAMLSLLQPIPILQYFFSPSGITWLSVLAMRPGWMHAQVIQIRSPVVILNFLEFTALAEVCIIIQMVTNIIS